MPDRPAAIYSTYEDDPERLEAINDFVIGLAEGIDALQDLHSAGDLQKLGRCAAKMQGEAQALGYPVFAQAAGAVVDACREEKSDAAETGVVEMAHLSLAIRRAHRGAA